MADDEMKVVEQDDGNYTFDVGLSIPEWADKDLIKQRANQELGLPPNLVDQLMHTISAQRIVKIKTNAKRAEADAEALIYQAVGFRAEVTHSLALKKLPPLEEDKRIYCPACDVKVELPASSQCPNCQVFVNRLTPAAIQKIRADRQEAARVELLVRAQQSGEYLPLRKDYTPKIVLASVLLAVIAIGGYTEREQISQSLGFSKKPSIVNYVAIEEKDDEFQNTLRQTFQLQLDISKRQNAGTAEPSQAPLRFEMKSAELPNYGATESSSAATINSTSNTGNNIDPSTVGTTISSTSTSTSSSTSSSTNNAAEVGSSATPAASTVDNAAPTAPALSTDAKQEIHNELITMLAEVGQLARGRELLAKAAASAKASNDTKWLNQLAVVQVKLEAWAIVYAKSEQATAQIEELSRLLSSVPDAASRAIASAHASAIIMYRADLNQDAVTGLFSIMDLAYRAQKNKSSSNEVGHEIVVARGKAIFNNAQAKLSRGQRAAATDLAGQLDTMTRIAPEASAAVLFGFSQQLSRIMGNPEGAKASLKFALEKAQGSKNLVQEGESLRTIADFEGVYQELRVQAALTSLSSAAEQKGGMEYAATLVEIALTHARNGSTQNVTDIQNKLLALAATKPELALHAERLQGLQGIALAWHAKRSANFKLAERRLQAVQEMVE